MLHSSESKPLKAAFFIIAFGKKRVKLNTDRDCTRGKIDGIVNNKILKEKKLLKEG